MGQKAMVINVNKCTACFNCFIACKDEFAGQSWLPFSEAQPDTGQHWIVIDEIERGQFPHVKSTFVPRLCMLCQDPLCVKASKNGAAYQRDDGIVVLDPMKSKGQRQIVKACRYGRVYWNEELNIPQKCDFCVHLLEKGWKEPRCVEACPARVFTFGEKEDLIDLITKAVQLHPEYKSDPAVHYIGLPKTFISGSVFCAINKDCLEGVEITLNNKQTGNDLKTITNNYGDFEFDGLKVGSFYRVTLKAAGYLTMVLDDIGLQEDLHLGNLYLNKSP